MLYKMCYWGQCGLHSRSDKIKIKTTSKFNLGYITFWFVSMPLVSEDEQPCCDLSHSSTLTYLPWSVGFSQPCGLPRNIAVKVSLWYLPKFQQSYQLQNKVHVLYGKPNANYPSQMTVSQIYIPMYVHFPWALAHDTCACFSLKHCFLVSQNTPQ